MPDGPEKRSTTFCALPWMHRFTNIGGEIEVCCTSEEYDNRIRDDRGKEMTAPECYDDGEIMNTKFMRDLRLEMLKGKWPAMCERCRLTECNGAISRRQTENKHYEDVIPKLLATTEADGRIPVEIMSADYRLGNLCNLACRMCSPRSSTRWIREWRQIDQAPWVMSAETEKEFGSYDWYQSKDFLAEFQRKTGHLRHLHFAGGEPLIIPQMVDFLQACVDNGDAKRIEITYNTNITKLPPAIKKLWPHFKGVKLLCSVDGFGPVNDFIRHGSHWSTIDRNLRDLDKNHEAFGVTEVQIMCTVQAYNVLKLGELYDYLAEEFSFVNRLPYLIDLHFPDYYSTQVLPVALKAKAVEHLREILAKAEARITAGTIPTSSSYILESLRGALNFITGRDLSDRVPDFLRAAESKDRLRKQKFDGVVPALGSLREWITRNP